MRFFRNKRLFIFLIGFILLVVLVGYTFRDRINVTFAEEFINDAVGWVQYVVHTPVNFTTDVFTNIKDFRNTYEENQILKEQLSQYRSLIYEVQEVNKENEELRDVLDLMESDSIRSHEAIQAIVIARSPERWLEQVTINKGEKHGVQANMLVMTADGMIGKVQSANDVTARVKLLTGFDQFNRISAMVSRDEGRNIFGMIEGFDEETNSLLFRIIEESEKDIAEDDLVVSSGMGGVFPAGVPIGTVKEVTSDQYGLTQIALVEPASDMYDINHVIVLDRAVDQVDESSEAADEEEEDNEE
ncbi:rod shape-determining protein MreC [Oceanobacillus alkalisoli]|uniref:rod shape-determining protein MreC n=1 Tax=Oceanobacillus alkalisoli TaxID=2925113 RepID=UPI001EF14A88|nr:rod shape-determining protein MreC [Oceanobacillus alkalisoli]MCF3941890.1 rod shape-determining protein MreC [Oceanobacillus alkalisoli]MCG5104265.1 rod shape-determining protein MreC [Oceanobacillus alkalisoli]